jgi:hypothetical protein
LIYADVTCVRRGHGYRDPSCSLRLIEGSLELTQATFLQVEGAILELGACRIKFSAVLVNEVLQIFRGHAMACVDGFSLRGRRRQLLKGLVGSIGPRLRFVSRGTTLGPIRVLSVTFLSQKGPVEVAIALHHCKMICSGHEGSACG